MTTSSEPAPLSEPIEPPEPTDAWKDLGGQDAGPLSPESEEALHDANLGSQAMRQRVEQRRRARAKAEEDAARFSPEQQVANRLGLAKALDKLYESSDAEVDPEELKRRNVLRIARGQIKPPTKPDDQTHPVTGREKFIKVLEGPSVNFEEAAVALEALMKVLSLYNQVSHAEASYTASTNGDKNPGRKIDGMMARANKAMREASPHVDVLIGADRFKQLGYSPEEILEMRRDMIKYLKDYGAHTTSKERHALVERVQAAAKAARTLK